MIRSRSPARGYTAVDNHRRGDLDIAGNPDDGTRRFSVFVRQNARFIENFSIGLRYHSDDPTYGTITLVRYNGPHGERSRDPDGHYARPHIHRITADEVQSGSREPKERHREITDRYSTFETALHVFLSDAGIMNLSDYFPELLQLRLFDDR